MTEGGHSGARREEPLDLPTWIGAATQLANDVRSVENVADDRFLRRAYHLARLLPDPHWNTFTCTIGEDAFEALLSADITDAVTTFANLSLLVEVKVGGKATTVNVSAPGVAISGTLSSSSLARAFVGAWLLCIKAATRQCSQEAQSQLSPA